MTERKRKWTPEQVAMFEVAEEALGNKGVVAAKIRDFLTETDIVPEGMQAYYLGGPHYYTQYKKAWGRLNVLRVSPTISSQDVRGTDTLPGGELVRLYPLSLNDMEVGSNLITVLCQEFNFRIPMPKSIVIERSQDHLPVQISYPTNPDFSSDYWQTLKV